MNNIIKPISIIGCGGIVRDAHLPAYQKAGLEINAVYDLIGTQASQLAQQFQIKTVCSSLEELIAHTKSIGGVYDLAVPASEILKILPFIPPGSGILIQKPMGENLEQAKKILKICNANKLIAGINFQLRHAPYIQKAKELIDKGLIGQLHEIEFRNCVFTPWHLWDFLYKAERMEMLYFGIHYIDLIRYFFGNPDRVYASSIQHPKMKGLSSSRSALILDYGKMKRACIFTNHGHEFGIKHQESFIKFEGTQGAIKVKIGVYLDYPKGKPDKFEYVSLKEGKDWREVSINGTWFPDAFSGPMLGLMQKIANPNLVYINDVKDAIQTMAVLEAAYESDQLGGVVPDLDL